MLFFPLAQSAEVWRRYKTDPLYHCTFVETMRVVAGLLLLLLGLCGSGAQGEAGGLGEVAEINQNTDPKHPAEESTQQSTKQTDPDVWTELRALRDMVVEQQVHMELLQRENSGTDWLLFLLVMIMFHWSVSVYWCTYCELKKKVVEKSFKHQ